MSARRRIRAVVFDVGYTLVDEARSWAEWAALLGVPPTRLMDELRAVIAVRAHHRTVFARLQPGFDFDAAARGRSDAGFAVWEERDLYPDARPCLATLKAAGVVVGLAGNQPPEALQGLRRMALPVDWIANSAELGVEKPAPEFFSAVAARCGCAPEHIAYVGDRIDNDVLPAQRAGMIGVFLVRGPWGEAHARWPEAASANVRVATLDALPAALAITPSTA